MCHTDIQCIRMIWYIYKYPAIRKDLRYPIVSHPRCPACTNPNRHSYWPERYSSHVIMVVNSIIHVQRIMCRWKHNQLGCLIVGIFVLCNTTEHLICITNLAIQRGKSCILHNLHSSKEYHSGLGSQRTTRNFRKWNGITATVVPICIINKTLRQVDFWNMILSPLMLFIFFHDFRCIKWNSFLVPLTRLSAQKKIWHCLITWTM